MLDRRVKWRKESVGSVLFGRSRRIIEKAESPILGFADLAALKHSPGTVVRDKIDLIGKCFLAAIASQTQLPVTNVVHALIRLTQNFQLAKRTQLGQQVLDPLALCRNLRRHELNVEHPHFRFGCNSRKRRIPFSRRRSNLRVRG